MPKIFIDFLPAEVKVNREVYVAYHVVNPLTGKMERKRIRLNHIHGKAERVKYARALASEINIKLYDGWNPFVEEQKKCKGVTFSVALDTYRKEKVKAIRKDSARSYSSFLAKLESWIDLRKKRNAFLYYFDEDEARLFMRWIEPGLSGTTYNNHRTFYHSFFAWLIRKGWIRENPFDVIEAKREEEKFRTIIPPEERKKIAAYFIDTGQREYLYIMQLCYRCFIRPKEILMLKIGYVNFDESLINIPADVAKNHKARTVGIPEEIMSYLRTLRDKPSNLYIFSTDYKPGLQLLSSRETGRTWKVMRDALGLPASYQFYSLKDTGITEMLEAGVPAKFVKELADHHSLEMTEKYTHKSNAKKILEWNKLEF